MSAEAGMVWAAKGAGATLGSAISLAYLLPRGPREAAIRFAVGATTGLLFGSTTGLWLAARLDLGGQLPETELALVGSAAASLTAWWALGAVQRFAGRIARDDGRTARGDARSARERMPLHPEPRPRRTRPPRKVRR